MSEHATKEPLRLQQMQTRPRRFVRAGFDSAQTTSNNRRHWAQADGLSADAAASAEVRRTLRNRARYEVANNSYARGMILTLANDTIGTGPRLQMLTGDPALNHKIEQEFQAWSMQTSLAEKLRTMRMARSQDGEGFGILVTNPRIEHPIQLDVRLVEADQVSCGDFAKSKDNEIDGIRMDRHGNPVSYRVLTNHPGASALDFGSESVSVPARSMIHIFRADRPGQHRGIPEITPALPLFAQLRRFTLAVLSAAEAAADFAGILYTDSPPNGESDPVEPMDMIELHRNMLLTMPGGWKMSQVDPKQPATTYSEFKKEILNEIARCLNIPYNIAAGNSGGYNYASGRLDHQSYYKSICVDQAFIACKVLDPILQSWLLEYALVHGFPGSLFGEGSHIPKHQWFWDGTGHVDPAKEARAQEIRLKNNATNLSIEYAKIGLDWEECIRQRARENKLMAELGMTVEGKE